MDFVFHIPMRAVSLNHDKMPIRFGKSLRLINNPKHTKYKKDIERVLVLKYGALLKDIKKLFNPNRDLIKMHYAFYYDNFYTAKGDVSSKKPDNDNPIKIIKDVLFKAIDINDKYVVCDHAISSAGRNEIVFQLEIVSRTEHFAQVS